MRALTETKVIRFFNHSHGPQNQDYQHRDKHQRGFTAGFVEDSHESPQLWQACCFKKKVSHVLVIVHIPACLWKLSEMLPG